MGQLERPVLLDLRSVSKHYGAMAAVDNLSFAVAPREVLGIGGPNGAGKTTLFDAISGLSPADAGEIQFDGQDIRSYSPDRIRHLGIARTYQLNYAFDTLTVRENVLSGAYYGHRNVLLPGLCFDRDAQRRADEALELVGLQASSDVAAANLPVLQLKLLMVAAALASEPKLLLLDEPVGGLNRYEIDQMFALLNRIRKERSIAIILIEHVMRFVVALADRMIIMHHGRKIYEGTPRGVAQDEAVVKVYLGESVAGRLQHYFDKQSADDRQFARAE